VNVPFIAIRVPSGCEGGGKSYEEKKNKKVVTLDGRVMGENKGEIVKLSGDFPYP